MAVTVTYGWDVIANTQLNGFTTGSQGDVALAGNAAGTRLFGAWDDSVDSLSAVTELYATADGTPFTSDNLPLNTTTNGQQFGPASAGLNNGTFVLTG